MPDDLLELVAPGGVDEANHGTERYRVDNDGHVRVPREAAHYLIRFAGFRPAPEQPEAASGPFPQPQQSAPPREPRAPQRAVPRSNPP
jgi:hypothetical protein